MKRLRKFSEDGSQTLELYHYTSAQHFMKIMESGQILPAANTGNTSNGGSVKHYTLAEENEQGYDFTAGDLYNMIEDADLNSFVIDQSVVDYINEIIISHDEAEDEIVRVKTYFPSGNQGGVYLTEDSSDQQDYGLNAVQNPLDSSLPNFIVCLKVRVSSENLLPDLDDAEVDSSSSTPEWQQTLDSVGQCVYGGPVPLDLIKGVQIKDWGFVGGSKFTDNTEFYNWVEEKGIKFESYVSANEIQNQLTTLLQEYANIGNEVTSRLIKRIFKNIYV